MSYTPTGGDARQFRSGSVRSGVSISRYSRGRRRSLGSATPKRSSSLANSFGPENDDAAERQAALQKRRARRPSFLYTPNKLPQSRAINTPRLLGWSNRRTPIAKQVLNKNALCDMYQTVLARVAKGAINKKNAWDVKMCSYVPELVNMEESNFARNGTIINSASIVLAHQIDAVHDRGHRVWKNLVTNSKDDKTDAQKLEAARLKRRYNKKTLATKGMIETKIELLKSSRDPFFEKTAASFDAGGSHGLMVQNLTTQKSGSLIFNCEEKLDAFAPKSNQYPEVEVIPENILESIPFPSKRRLKRTRGLFPQASTCNRTIEFYNKQAEAIEQGIDDHSIFDQSMDCTQKLDFEESIIDDSFALGPESDGLDDCGNANELAEAEQDQLIDGLEDMTFDPDGEQFVWDGEQPPEGPHAFEAPDLNELETFFNRNNQWSGMNRKVALIRRRDRMILNAEEEKKQRKRRKINFFDFVQRCAENEDLQQLELTQEQIEAEDRKLQIRVMTQVDQRLFHNVDPKSLTLTRKVKKQWRTEPRILPRDFKVEPDMFFRPSLRPNLKLHCPERKVQHASEQSDPLFDEPILPDQESSAPLDLSNDADIDIGGPVPIMDENLGELLNWNDKKEAKKLEIPYTREPCEFNVSMMKKRIWRRICTNGKETEDGEKAITYDALFQAVVVELPKKTVRTITIHIFYVCLLYCCNEYKLRLKQPGIDDCDNFEIFTTKESPLPSRPRPPPNAFQ